MKLYPDRTLPLMTARTFHCSPQARELGEACASINEVVSQYRQAFQLRKNHDKNHLCRARPLPIGASLQCLRRPTCLEMNRASAV